MKLSVISIGDSVRGTIKTIHGLLFIFISEGNVKFQLQMGKNKVVNFSTEVENLREFSEGKKLFKKTLKNLLIQERREMRTPFPTPNRKAIQSKKLTYPLKDRLSNQVYWLVD